MHYKTTFPFIFTYHSPIYIYTPLTFTHRSPIYTPLCHLYTTLPFMYHSTIYIYTPLSHLHTIHSLFFQQETMMTSHRQQLYVEITKLYIIKIDYQHLTFSSLFRTRNRVKIAIKKPLLHWYYGAS